MSDAAGFSLLAWDTDFFGCRIARVDEKAFGPGSASDILARARDGAIDCLYLLVEADNSEAVRTAEKAGFQLVDVRVTRERGAPDAKARALPPEIGLYQEGDIEALCAIARESHGDSRFYHDSSFSRSRCDDLYETWIRNACSGAAAAVVVARSEQRAVGYVTCEHPKPALGNLGLVAVAADQAGRGYGARMVEGALGWLAGEGCERIQVVTQARNIPASRLYESKGFKTISVENSYHLWLGEAQ